MYRLISATPSPYARKVRIALIEKGIPFELVTEVPWDTTTQTPKYNPLEKLPILICLDGASVYESRFILEYLELKHPETSLLPGDVDGILAAKRLEVLCDGVCDAFVLLFMERARAPDKQSQPWMARQRRKIDGGLKEIERLVGGRDPARGAFAVGNSFSLGDIAAGTVFKYLCIRWPDNDLRSAYPALAGYSDALEQRPSFKATVPVPQKISDPVV
jgi:glutathione S-transferase